MRSRLVAALVGAGLLSANAARAEDPCASDVKLLCGEVEVGGGRVQDCLRKNEAKLSPACKAQREATEVKFRRIVEEFGTACRGDSDRLCSQVRAGGGRILACLLRQQDDLSSACRAQTERYQAAAETITNVRAACRADVERLCAGTPTDAKSIIECLQANREKASDTCRSVDTQMGMAAAELVDAVEALSSQERAEEALQILQGIDSIAFSRSQVLIQVDSYQGFAGIANANRLLFNPQVVFGDRHEFALQLKAPVITVYPYAADRAAQTGLGAVTTAFAWGFFSTPRVHMYLSGGLQWVSPSSPPVGSSWAVVPGTAISVGVLRWLSLTGQVGWFRSFSSSGFPELNLMLFEPIVVLNLPGRTFFALDTRLGWNLGDSAFLPVMKGIVGLYVDRRKSLSISAWYQSALSNDAEEQFFKFGVGAGLAYFFDW